MRLSLHAPALDGIRGIAVLLVVLGHLGNLGLFLVPGVAHDLLGKQGVWLFFALSAFLLTGRLTEDLESARDSRGALAAYAVHRVFRIFPLYALVIGAHWWLGDFSARVAALHLLLRKGLGELWAIPVEFTYYLVIPLVAGLAVRFGRGRARQVLLAALAVELAFNLAYPLSVFWNTVSIHGKLVPFFAGSLGALLALDRAPPARPAWHRLGLPALPVAGFAASSEVCRAIGLGEVEPGELEAWVGLGLAVFGTAAISLALEPNWLGRLASAAPLAFFGRVSFSLYLWHGPIARAAGSLPPSLPSALRAWLCFLPATAVAWLSYRFIERPGIALGRRIARALRLALGRDEHALRGELGDARVAEPEPLAQDERVVLAEERGAQVR